MATADELLSTLDTDKTLIIDKDLRIITIPSSVKNLGVESDDDVLRLKFSMPRMYGDVDLSDFSIYINYMNAKNTGDVYVVDDKTIADDTITFSWLVGRVALAYKGNVRFIVCMKKHDDNSNVIQEYNTTIASLPVLEGLETGETVIQQNPDIIEMLLTSSEPLIGTTQTITPSQVLAAIKAGRDIALQYTDSYYGAFVFSAFNANEKLGIVVSNSILPQWNGLTGTLLGFIEDDAWLFKATNTATKDDVGTAVNEALTAAKASGEFDGADGLTPTIGENGNWYLGNTDTNKPSRGKSAYSYAQDGGYTGTEAEFAAKLAAESIDKALFVVNITANSDGTFSADKTFEEIINVYNEGKYNIVAHAASVNNLIFPLLGIGKHSVLFGGTTADGIIGFLEFIITDNNEVQIVTAPLATKNDKLPNPYPLTFTGAVSETYDGSSAKTIEIPSGGGGETATPELLYSGTAENVSAFQQNIDMKGHKRFCVIVGGTKGESAISISKGFFYLGEKEYKIFYYTDWLDATAESYPNGCVIEHFALVDENKIAITYQKITTSLNGISDVFQGNSSQFTAPKLAVLQGKNVAKEDGITLSFSAVVESVTVYIFGY